MGAVVAPPKENARRAAVLQQGQRRPSARGGFVNSVGRRAGPLAPRPTSPVKADLTGKLCRQADIESEWFRYWCQEVHSPVLYHRKVWEWALVLQTLWEAGMLGVQHSGIGFAIGREPLPSTAGRYECDSDRPLRQI